MGLDRRVRLLGGRICFGDAALKPSRICDSTILGQKAYRRSGPRLGLGGEHMTRLGILLAAGVASVLLPSTSNAACIVQGTTPEIGFGTSGAPYT